MRRWVYSRCQWGLTGYTSTQSQAHTGYKQDSPRSQISQWTRSQLLIVPHVLATDDFCIKKEWGLYFPTYIALPCSRLLRTVVGCQVRVLRFRSF